jgi:hypothetical protein
LKLPGGGRSWPVRRWHDQFRRGAFLLRQTDQRLNLLPRLAECFPDGRNPKLIEHTIQRVYGLALGYEDINDHEQLRNDPVFGILAGREDLNEPLAGKSIVAGEKRPRFRRFCS